MSQLIEDCRDFVFVIIENKDTIVVNVIIDNILKHFNREEEVKIKDYLIKTKNKIKDLSINDINMAGNMLANKLKEI